MEISLENLYVDLGAQRVYKSYCTCLARKSTCSIINGQTGLFSSPLSSLIFKLYLTISR